MLIYFIFSLSNFDACHYYLPHGKATGIALPWGMHTRHFVLQIPKNQSIQQRPYGVCLI